MTNSSLDKTSKAEALITFCKTYKLKDAESFEGRLHNWKIGFYNHHYAVDTVPTELKATKHYERLSKVLVKLESLLVDAPQILHLGLSKCTEFPSPESKKALERHGIIRDYSDMSEMDLNLFLAQVATLSIRAKEIVAANENDALDYRKPTKEVVALGRQSDKSVIRNARNFWLENGNAKFKPYYFEGKPKNAAARYLIDVFNLLNTDTTISNIETALKALKKE
jgi:hypothetical protein